MMRRIPCVLMRGGSSKGLYFRAADLPADPASLANIAASVLQIDTDEKQQRLTTNSIGEMLVQISDLLQRELRGLQIVQSSRLAPPDELIPFSLN